MAASFESTFHIPGMDPMVLMHCHYQFNQPDDVRGRPNAGVRSGLIRVTLLGTDNGTLASWGVDPLKALSGKIVFKDSEGGTLKTLQFYDTYCVEYREVFVSGSTTAAYTFDLGLTARRINLNNAEHDNMWLDWKPGQ
ncbi:type VI secretion system tube protein TssD [Fibrella sp. WM1]|uniref:type VI secretion system tube protein TssD n=1 Tax=Fibrella musci TaxID=3242485 RepID=UPI0035209A12